MTPREKILREGLERITRKGTVNHAMIARETLAKADAAPKKGPFTLERDEAGFGNAILENGNVILWLKAGTKRGEDNVDRIVALLNAAPKDGWIAVSERLPDEDHYLNLHELDRIVLALGNGRPCIVQYNFHPDYFTHWQPLPEPPK